ncbi:MAG: DUF445 domain-containing protein [Negativicutes bacterium]|nr:DUF445 domain-containing protein [Negativicutes bacterium]
MRTNKHKATITLAVVSLIFFISRPFADSFWGGLVHSGAAAAMIGGLADWFAVAALFRRPLGIPFRTALIPRNREKIFAALANMVERDLLTPENIRRTLARYDVVALLNNYLTQRGGADDMRQTLLKIAAYVIAGLKPEKIGRVVELVIKKNVEQTKLAPIVADALEWLVEQRYHVQIANFAAKQIGELMQHDQVLTVLAEVLAEARGAYERGLARRRLFNVLLNVSPAELAHVMQKLIVSALEGMQAADHPLHHKIQALLQTFIHDLRTQPGLQAKVEAWKLAQLDNLHLREAVAAAVGAFRDDKPGSEAAVERLIAQAAGQLDRILQDTVRDEAKCRAFGDKIKDAVALWAGAHQGELSGIVLSSLNQFSNEMLVKFVEDRVGDDLQMIRINGSVVGGLAGMIIFCGTYWLM